MTPKNIIQPLEVSKTVIKYNNNKTLVVIKANLYNGPTHD